MNNILKISAYAVLSMAALFRFASLSAEVDMSSGLASPQQTFPQYQQQQQTPYQHPYQPYNNDRHYGDYGYNGGEYGQYGYNGGNAGGGYQAPVYGGYIGGAYIDPYPPANSEPGMGDDSNALYQSYLQHNNNGY